jgi:hypothetical protein
MRRRSFVLLTPALLLARPAFAAKPKLMREAGIKPE